MKEKLIQTMATPSLRLVIDPDDGTQPREYRLVLDYRALAMIEEKTKRDLKDITAWKDLSSGKDWPVIIHCCLNRHHPNESLDDVYSFLPPQAQRELSDALFELTFPGITEAYNKLQRDGVTADPNAETATQKA